MLYFIHFLIPYAVAVKFKFKDLKNEIFIKSLQQLQKGNVICMKNKMDDSRRCSADRQSPTTGAAANDNILSYTSYAAAFCWPWLDIDWKLV